MPQTLRSPPSSVPPPSARSMSSPTRSSPRMPEPADWPEPVEALNERGSSEILLLCEHASNHVPDEYAGLGLPADQLQRHIAWDIGAAAVTRRLSQLLGAAAFLGTYSRLLIDLNRPLDAPDSIPARSESTDIPDNAQLTPFERARRADIIFTPFHRRVTAYLDPVSYTHLRAHETD